MRNLPKKDFVAHYVIYTDDWFLEDSVDSAIDFVDKIVIARTLKPWNGQERDLSETEAVLDMLQFKYGDRIEIYEAEFESEQQQRNFLLERSREEGYRGAFIIDTDEIFLEKAFRLLYDHIRSQNPKAIRSSYYTFIKDASFTVTPPFETNLFYVSLTDNLHFTWARKINAEQLVIHTDDPGILHFSYLRKTDSDILNKIQNFMHNKDADWEKWYQEVYRKFNKNLQNFHPVDPQAWSGLMLFDISKFPPALREKLRRHGKLFYHDRVLNNSDLKLHLGCGNQLLDGYINIDLYNPKAELTLDIEDLSYFDDNSVSEIFMNAVFEHLYVFQQIPCLLEWKRVLKPNGVLRIESIPDFDIYAKAYFDGAPGNVHETFDLFEVYRYTHGDYTEENKIGQMHKDIFNKEKVRRLLEEAGFEIIEIKNVTWGNEPLPYNINVKAVKRQQTPTDIEKAEQFLQDGDLINSRKILERILKQRPGDINALNNLAVLEIKENNFELAAKLLEKVFLLDPNNELAVNNYYYLTTLGKTYISNNKLKSAKHFIALYGENRTALQNLSRLRTSFKNESFSTAKGICPICFDIVDYNLHREADGNINWQESLVCPKCGLNSRQRAALFYLLAKTGIKEQTKIFITEQSTPFYRFMKLNYPFSVGSDYWSRKILGKNASAPFIPTNFFDVVISFEILSYQPDYRHVLSDFYKSLKSGGTLLLTVPFALNNENSISLKRKTPSDPLHLFGWELLQDLRQTGFKDAFVFYYWSDFFGLYQPDILVVAIK